jgi:hypothetical protein
MMDKQSTRDSLIEHIQSELKKNADDIDPDLIDRRIDGLYALDGLSPPKTSDEQLRAALRTIRARADWRRRNRLAEGAVKRRFIRRAVRWTVAACFMFLLLFSANYVSALITGACLPSKVGIKICCGTKYCLCDTKEEKVLQSN